MPAAIENMKDVFITDHGSSRDSRSRAFRVPRAAPALGLAALAGSDGAAAATGAAVGAGAGLACTVGDAWLRTISAAGPALASRSAALSAFDRGFTAFSTELAIAPIAVVSFSDSPDSPADPAERAGCSVRLAAGLFSAGFCAGGACGVSLSRP